MSSDKVSSLFPDRPIRPLPKRRLRERLSPELARSIQYPPSTQDVAPLFYFPCYAFKGNTNPSSAESSPVDHGLSQCRDARRAYDSHLGELAGGNGAGDNKSLSGPFQDRSTADVMSQVANQTGRASHAFQANPQPPPSTTSSADGYESFENTNNKKKRKIPSAGDSSLNSTHALNAEITSLAISSNSGSCTADMNGEKFYGNTAGHSTTSAFMPSSQGISGSGRGRLGRLRNGRSPLRALADGNSTCLPRAKSVAPQWTQSGKSGIRFIYLSYLPHFAWYSRQLGAWGSHGTALERLVLWGCRRVRLPYHSCGHYKPVDFPRNPCCASAPLLVLLESHSSLSTYRRNTKMNS